MATRHDPHAAVADRVVGVSHACAQAFGAEEEATEHGFRLVSENMVPGTSGLPSLARLLDDGYTVLSF